VISLLRATAPLHVGDIVRAWGSLFTVTRVDETGTWCTPWTGAHEEPVYGLPVFQQFHEPEETP
jgi:hypothetical protein